MARLAKYNKEIPEIDTMLNVMTAHFENNRFSEIWNLSEHWTIEYIQFNKKSNAAPDELEALFNLKQALQDKNDELYEKMPPYKEYEGMTYTDPYLFLEFVEVKLNEYGRELEKEKGFSVKGVRYLSSLMDSLIHDIYSFFNVWSYNDLFTIEDENIRLKIAELVRLNMKYQGIEFVTEHKSAPQHKGLESLL